MGKFKNFKMIGSTILGYKFVLVEESGTKYADFKNKKNPINCETRNSYNCQKRLKMQYRK